MGQTQSTNKVPPNNLNLPHSNQKNIARGNGKGSQQSITANKEVLNRFHDIDDVEEEDEENEFDEENEDEEDEVCSNSSEEYDRQSAKLSAQRRQVATALQLLWKNSTWLGFAKLDQSNHNKENGVIPLDIRVTTYDAATNTLRGTRHFGQQRQASPVTVKMYFVHTDSAEVVISITDNATKTIGGGDSFTLKLVADTIRGKGHSVTGHCVVTSRESGRQHGVFELLRDRLTQDGEITSDDGPKSKITTANTTAKTSSLSIKRIASDLTNTTTDNAADTPVSGMYAKPSNTPLYYNTQHQQYQNSINTDDQPNDPFSEEPDHHHTHTHNNNNNLNHRMTNRLSYNSATTTNASVILDEAEDGDGEYTTGEMCAVVCEN